ncbi:MAG: cytochrome c peroxidase [Gammaproteobacteria bacterium]
MKASVSAPAIVILLTLLTLTACQKPEELAASNKQEVAAPGPWLDLQTTNARYRLRIDENYTQIPAGQMHYWDIHVATNDEQPLSPKQIKVSGWMPGHGHGMATFPLATTMKKEGLMRVKGMKFHMGGEWRMRIDVVDAAGPDYAYFNFNVQPAPTKAPPTVLFTPTELAQLKALHLSSLAPLQKDASNKFSQNPAAAALGRALFFDVGLSRSGTVSCATCHNPELGFGDGKILSFGTAKTERHAPALTGVAHSTWFYWDGRRDSLWSQALSPLESSGEMDNTRGDVLRYVVSHPEHGPAFKRLTGFGEELLTDLDSEGMGPADGAPGRIAWNQLRPPQKERLNTAFSIVGKVLAAFEETIQHAPSRFDQFVEVLLDDGENAAAKLLSRAEIRGAKLYANENKTPCLRCHNGPLFTNQEFHNIDTGLSARGNFDAGRKIGARLVQLDEFNCYGVFSDATRQECTALTFGRGNHLEAGAFKTPGLRNVVNTAPYFHDGRMPTLETVVAHYLASEGDTEDVHEMPKFELTPGEASDLIAFLKTL